MYIYTTDVHLSASLPIMLQDIQRQMTDLMLSTRRSKHRVNTSEDPAWPVSGMTSTPVCPWAKALTYKAPEDIAITCNNQSMMYFNDRWILLKFGRLKYVQNHHVCDPGYQTRFAHAHEDLEIKPKMRIRETLHHQNQTPMAMDGNGIPFQSPIPGMVCWEALGRCRSPSLVLTTRTAKIACMSSYQIVDAKNQDSSTCYQAMGARRFQE